MFRQIAIALCGLALCSAAYSQAQPGTVDAAVEVATDYMALIYQAKPSQLKFGPAENDGGVLSIPVHVVTVDRQQQPVVLNCRPTFVPNVDVVRGWQISNPRCVARGS